MYWVRYQPLKDQLKKRLISDREALPYLLWFCGLEAVVLSFPVLSEMNKWDVIEAVLYVLVVLAGVFYVYHRNGGKKGYDVIPKFIILGWVVAIRYLFAAIPVAGFVYFTAYYYGISGDKTTLFDAVFFTGLSALYYERLGRHIADTNEMDGEQIVSPDH